MKTFSFRIMAILVMGMVVSLVGSPVSAEIVYSTDFSDTTTGELPTGWSADDGYATWTVDENDELAPSDVTDDSSTLCEAAGTFTDGTITATFHNGYGRAGIVGRVVDDETYYVMRVKGETYLEVYWNTSTGYGRIVNLALDPDYDYDDMCTATLTFDGENISGEVRNSSDTVLGSFNIVDNHITSAGYAGVRANDDSFGCDTFQVDVVPEPGTVILLISALVGLLIVRRKR
ncbi:MAG: PEP-CTERM sorting domain-containing protein [Pirellulales bacterium]|nr:PEP-CTERM sorting domain-containing protein [Pirellulales bacterium]